MTLQPRHETNLALNLRALCERRDTIANVCRRIGISRQQFNKYLSGKHNPSRRNVQLICQYFAIDPLDLFLSPDLFARQFENANFAAFSMLRKSPRFGLFAEAIANTGRDIKAYHGVYERYHYSSIYQGKVVRSVVCIYEAEGCTCYCYVERFPSFDHPRRADYIFKYYGICCLIEDRLFLFDFEMIQKNEMTFSILIPRHRNSSEFLFGTTMGVAATLFREPFATRAAFHFRGRGPLTMQHLRRAWTLDPADPSIPAEIRFYLGNEPHMVRGN